MIGQTIFHYTIVEKLGAGGMGVVFKAVDQKLDRIVALKFLPPSYSTNDEIKRRFIQEAKAVSKLQHNNICTIHEINETDEGQLFICMDYYEGKSLKEKLEGEKLKINEALDITIQICEGLKHAHEKNIVHRDIKPANIFITNDGIVKILDFGLAKINGDTQLTKAGSTLGTTAYMSPEQAKGESVDQRTDIWSLGVVFYQMVSGKLPFKGEYDQAIIYSIINKTPEELNTAKKIKSFVNKCLQKKPGNRYQSIDEILVEFYLISPDAARENSFIKNRKVLQISRFIKRFGIFILLLSALLTWFLLRNFSSQLYNQDQTQVAVIPFTNIGHKPSGQAFCDGLIETLTSQLTQMPQFNSSIQVVPSSEILNRKISSVKEAYRVFGANLVVTGSIQKDNNQIRIILNLVDAKSLRIISSSIDDYSLSNVIAFQDKVVLQLAGMLQVRLKPNDLELINAGITNNTDAFIYYNQGKGYLQRYWDTKNIDDAIRLFHKSLSADSLFVYAFAGLGEAFLHKFREEKNISFMDSAVFFSKNAEKLNSDLPEVNIALGIISNEKGSYKQAISKFKKAIEKDKYNSGAYNGLAESYLALNLNEKAESTYKQAIELKPSYWVGYNDLGVFYYTHGKFIEALKQFNKVVELTPDNTYGLDNLGSMYMYLERWPEAAKTFKHVIDIKPDYTAYSNLGSLYYFHSADYTKAADMFSEALKLNQENYMLWGNLAAAYYQIPALKNKSFSCYEKAVELAEKDLKINPNNANTLSFLASYYSMLHDNNKAIKYLKQSLSFSPGDIDIITRGIETYEELGMRNSALELTDSLLKKGYPVSKLESTPGLKEMIKDKRFELLKEKYKNK